MEKNWTDLVRNADSAQFFSPRWDSSRNEQMRTKKPLKKNSPAWDFSRYQANAVMINLGTNDNGHGVSKATFQSTYTTFLRNIRAKYPHAVILVLETLRQVYVPETQAAVSTLNTAGDANVHYVSTAGWLTSSDYSSDGGHPNDTGQKKIANNLAPMIAKAIGVTI